MTIGADALVFYPGIRPAFELRCGQGRTREPFRQKESYDPGVRNRVEFEKIRIYIETNPVKAGLVRSPKDFPWSSAGVEMSLDAARKSACATVYNRQ